MSKHKQRRYPKRGEGWLTFQLHPGNTVIVGNTVIFVKRVGLRQLRLLFSNSNDEVFRLELLDDESRKYWLEKLPEDCKPLAERICELYKKRKNMVDGFHYKGNE